MRIAFFIMALLISVVCAAQADYAREQRWASEVVPTLVAGDTVYLTQKNSHKFLALYTAAKPPRSAVVLVHGLGVHPDWGLIGALRNGLADRGYATLSLQMPVLAADAQTEDYVKLFPDAAERITAGITFLRAQGYRNIAMASHSMGSRMSNYFLSQTPVAGVAAWISIGISNGEFADSGKLRLPVLDIYGERDFPQVLKNAAARAQVLQKLKGSAQIEVAGADHFFTSHERELVGFAQKFLDQRVR